MARVGRKGLKGGAFEGLGNFYEIWPWMLDFEWEETYLGPPPEIQDRWPTYRVSRKDERANRYLHDESHDAFLGEVVYRDGVLEMEVHDYNLWRCATAFSEYVAPRTRRTFSFVLRFEGVKSLAVWHPQEDGRLGRVRASFRRALTAGEQYLNDRVVRWDEDGFTGFFGFYRSTPYSFLGEISSWSYISYQMVIGVDAARVAVEEHQREQWAACFGEEQVWVYDAFQEVRVEGMQKEGYGWFEWWVQEKLRERGG